MEPDEAPKSVKVSKEDFDVISNRIAVALAKREALIKSWTASSSRQRSPEKTEAELEAEDAALFRNEPPYLGVGAPIPSHFLVSEAERNNKSLRAKFFPSKTLKASKTRDAEEKAASAKRGLKDESSDEEEGRSGLGRAKKRKTLKTEPMKDGGKKDLVDYSMDEGDSKLLKAQPKNVDHITKVTKADKRTLKSQDISVHHATNAGKDVQSKSTIEKMMQGLAAAPKINSDEEDSDSGDGMATRKGASSSVPAMLQKNGVMDPEERKRMKKREKRKRQKERLKAAGKA
ncbi:hypothetical protein N431DRAFT_439200 [Stipitochalara longipes BDJ]|nr:hypothetical protein N431DRAFT_439200 [Stipitochalara longipes BDJ]